MCVCVCVYVGGGVNNGYVLHDEAWRKPVMCSVLQLGLPLLERCGSLIVYVWAVSV